MISSDEWTQFRTELKNFSAEVGIQSVTWFHVSNNLSRYGEDGETEYTTRSLPCLVGYNDFRVWPVTSDTPEGDVDKQYCYLMINLDLLESIQPTWLTTEKSLDFDPSRDLFQVNGMMFEPAGDTPAAQDMSSPIYYLVSLKRSTNTTGVPVRG